MTQNNYDESVPTTARNSNINIDVINPNLVRIKFIHEGRERLCLVHLDSMQSSWFARYVMQYVFGNSCVIKYDEIDLSSLTEGKDKCVCGSRLFLEKEAGELFREIHEWLESNNLEYSNSVIVFGGKGVFFGDDNMLTVLDYFKNASVNALHMVAFDTEREMEPHVLIVSFVVDEQE